IIYFVNRLKGILALTPFNSVYTLEQYLKTTLGKATILDHHINRPGYVIYDFSSALNRLFNKYPQLSKNPDNWNDTKYESELLDDYGINRRMSKINKISVSSSRYSHLKKELQ